MRYKPIKVFAIGLLLSATLLAQGRGRPGSGEAKQSRIDFLATVLSLTEDQKLQATAIFEAAEQASAPLRESLSQQRQALNDAAKSNAADAQIDELAAPLGSLSGQIAAIQTKAFRQSYALLSEEQRQKLDELKTVGRGMRMGGELSFGPALH
jgi:Spy/CpxP family protein refolding chaperone